MDIIKTVVSYMLYFMCCYSTLSLGQLIVVFTSHFHLNNWRSEELIFSWMLLPFPVIFPFTRACRNVLFRLQGETIELYKKSLPKLQFIYSKRKVSTKLFYAPKRDEKKFGLENEATNE